MSSKQTNNFEDVENLIPPQLQENNNNLEYSKEITFTLKPKENFRKEEEKYLLSLYDKICDYCVKKGYAVPPKGIVDPSKMHVVSFNAEDGFENKGFYEFLGTKACMPLSDEELKDSSWKENMLKKSFNFPLFVNANSQKSFGAIVVPVEKKSGKFLLLKEWRLPLGNFVLDFPRGFPDKSEKAIITAMREFSEETGIMPSLSEMISLGVSYENTGYSYNALDVFYVYIESDVELKFEESSSAILLSKDELLRAISAGLVTDGLTLSALMKYLARKE